MTWCCPYCAHSADARQPPCPNHPDGELIPEEVKEKMLKDAEENRLYDEMLEKHKLLGTQT
ncbi:MAG: hypothetical protein AB1529_06990, partial [Candidatus Micrarchaeota archaeon]